MIDSITYLMDGDNLEKKTRWGTDDTVDVEDELAAIGAQLSDIRQGHLIEPCADGEALIANYEEQIEFLHNITQ